MFRKCVNYHIFSNEFCANLHIFPTSSKLFLTRSRCEATPRQAFNPELVSWKMCSKAHISHYASKLKLFFDRFSNMDKV
jgi:hypothetical protein